MNADSQEDIKGEHGNITALWAFSESGLGGVLHAFKTPFNGMVLAGMSVFCNGMLASFGGWRSIMRSLGLVLGVKAAISPHSPPTAYLAVAFQGSCGSLFFGLFGTSLPVYMVVGGLSLLESAIQRILVLTLLFGEQFWVAVNALIMDLAGFVGLTLEKPAYYLVIGYALLYTIWGMWVGYKAKDAQKTLSAFHIKYKDRLNESLQGEINNKRKRLFPRWIMAILIAGSAALLLIFSPSVDDGTFKAGLLVLQTLIILLLWYLILVPFLGFLIRKYAIRVQSTRRAEWEWLMQERLKLSRMMVPAWQLSGENYRGLIRLREALAIYCAWALYRNPS